LWFEASLGWVGMVMDAYHLSYYSGSINRRITIQEGLGIK
jgi:hypothetical protein